MQIALLVDASGSMIPDVKTTIDGVSEYLSGLKADKKTAKANITLATFNDIIGTKTLIDGVQVKDAKGLTSKTYAPAGMTPLFDAVGQMVAKIKALASKKERVLFAILTDGLENSSKEYRSAQAVSDLIKERSDTGRWTFVFLGADIDAWLGQSQMGVRFAASGNTASFAKADLVGTMSTMARRTRSYAHGRAAATQDFWAGDDKDKDQ